MTNEKTTRCDLVALGAARYRCACGEGLFASSTAWAHHALADDLDRLREENVGLRRQLQVCAWTLPKGALSVDALGERLRRLVFPGSRALLHYTPYRDDDVAPGAIALSLEKRAALLEVDLHRDEDDDPEFAAADAHVLEVAHGWRVETPVGNVDVAWYWDGDGTLVLRLERPDGSVEQVVSSCAKKPDYWHAVVPSY